MSTIVSRLCTMLSLVTLGVSVWATPALIGFTGTSNLPTADVATPQTASIALDLQDNNAGTTKSWRLIYGLSECAEVGMAFVDTQRTTWAGTLKYRFGVKEECATAVGALVASTSELTINIPPVITPTFVGATRFTGPPPPTTVILPGTTTYQLYAVHTRQLLAQTSQQPAVTGSLGGNWTAMKSSDTDISKFHAMASLEIRKGRTAFVADYQTAADDMDHRPMSSIALRYALSNRVNTELGFSNALGVLGGNVSRLFGGVSYQFGVR